MNMELAEQIARIIEETPERWNQQFWIDSNTIDPISIFKENDQHELDICGTTACVAGHAAWLYAPVETEFRSHTIRLPNGAIRSYLSYGREALRLHYKEAEYLFNSERTKEEVLDFLREPNDGKRLALATSWLEREGYHEY